MTTIRTFSAPIFSAVAAIALSFAMVSGTIAAPAQSPLNTASSPVYSA
jgi:hypothetical protein